MTTKLSKWAGGLIAVAGLALIVYGVVGLIRNPAPHAPVRTFDLGEHGGVAVPTSTATTVYTPANVDALRYEVVAEGLVEPVGAVLVPGTTETFLVVERAGRVVLAAGGNTRVVLDIRSRVKSEFIEQGLLSLAFHPDFLDNGRLFVSYTDVEGTLQVVELAADPGGARRIDPTSERRLLAVEQQIYIHQGGMVQFGPDGHLWIGLGDGGGPSSPDPLRNGQNRATLQGSLLRLDVDSGDPYAIPEDNPFVGQPWRGEIWAYGLRNPWRYTFDEGRVFVFDVGEHTWEEINVALLDEPGTNFGWSQTEGPGCLRFALCVADGITEPALALPWGPYCALIGGPLYRGDAIPELRGQLLFGDFCSGQVASAPFDGLAAGSPTVWTGLDRPNLTSFATDAAGEAYVTTLDGGLLRIVP
jgi:glucose/arabinose dehydrogenase